MSEIYSNIVRQDTLREIQRNTLHVIASAVEKSFGPNGSTTAIIKMSDANDTGVFVTHSKDGHTIIKNIQFTNSIERSVQDLITDMTRYIVKEVGDGTSSVALLCDYIFDALVRYQKAANVHFIPSEFMKAFHKIIQKINGRILAKGRECTLDDIKNICMIATNSNEEVSDTLYEIYKKYGLDTYIDIGISNQKDNIVREYPGMTLEDGFGHRCFINDTSNNTARIPRPRIYCFDDPIDTPEMLGLFDTIVENNILRCYRPNSVYEPIPTVIFCRAITPDSSSRMESLVKLMYQYPGSIPFLLVPNIQNDNGIYDDIVQMTGAKFIKKYIDPRIQEQDIKAGLAPTVETICDKFYGMADEVRSDQYKTQVLRPVKMFNPDGSYSDDYEEIKRYLETEVARLTDEDAGINKIARAKRRLNAFKGNMVDFLIGGVTLADREALKASVEDAVLNCRSAVINGVGYGANYMAYIVITDEQFGCDENGERYTLVTPEGIIIQSLFEAYKKIMNTLYPGHFEDMVNNETQYIQYDHAFKEFGMPLNLVTGEYDGKVLSSIKSDVVILDTIDKILTLMYTTNQALVPTPAHNIYERGKDKN